MAISALAERHLQIAEPGPDHLHAVATAFNPYFSPDGAGGAKGQLVGGRRAQGDEDGATVPAQLRRALDRERRRR